MRPNLAGQMDPAYLEAMYQRWQDDPGSLEESWQIFFQGFDLASCPRDCISGERAASQANVSGLVQRYRDLGHRLALINPLEPPPAGLPELGLANFNLSDGDLESVFNTGDLELPERATLQEIINLLRETYCGSIGVEFTHIQDVEVRNWLQVRLESSRNRSSFDLDDQKMILQWLVDAELLERFIQKNYLGQKRFSLEGAETLVAQLGWLVELSPGLMVEEMIIGMAHRGRLNVLANILQKSFTEMFGEFEDNFLPESVCGDGDVKYHKGYTSVYKNRQGQSLKLELAANPSHLEAVGPVVLGKVRARQEGLAGGQAPRRILPVLVHGDAAMAGQGIVSETFNLAGLAGYQVGGTLHLVVNNQIGFTTTPRQGRSSLYATDVAKLVDAPVLHVNGDDPEAAVHAATIALEFRNKFGRDVVIDLVCFRRYGHSEVDEPAYTQPVMYREIKTHPPVRELYTSRLVQTGVLTEDEEREIEDRFTSDLQDARTQAKGVDGQDPAEQTCSYEDLVEPVLTGVPRERLLEIAKRLVEVPDEFQVHPRLERQLPGRLQAVEQGQGIDWSLAEALALGSLLLDGVPVRLSGQDSQRGTFSQRHAVWMDFQDGRPHVPLQHLGPDQARFSVYNSPLSEVAVLGFEYGYSLADLEPLVLWEAQFGDFANGAQPIIDQFIVAAQSKWQTESGLTMLLPHGFEGQGPEHSNAYLERYLLAGAEQNIQVCVPSTPAQYFHVLRRQVGRPFRRPLILMTPKSLLRNPRAQSSLDALVSGIFQGVINDPAPPADVTRLVLCSGKVYYDLIEARAGAERADAALVRLEQLYPLYRSDIKKLLTIYPQAREVVWAQEEPQNRGAFSYLEPRLQALLGGRELRYAGRPASASPAVGSLRIHREEQAALVEDALGMGGQSK